jgi:hypothetical protein
MAALDDLRARLEREFATLEEKRAALDAYEQAESKIRQLFGDDALPGGRGTKQHPKPRIGPLPERECAECGRSFPVPTGRQGRRRYCSVRCRNRANSRARGPRQRARARWRYLLPNTTPGWRADGSTTAEGGRAQAQARAAHQERPTLACVQVSRAARPRDKGISGQARVSGERRRSPVLAASASGILLANGLLTREQHDAALRYAWAHALVFGKPWRQVCPLGERVGGEPPQRIREIARHKLTWMDGRLDLAQRKAVADVAVFGFLPMWWMATKLKLRSMPEDERDRQALLSGLDAISGAERPSIVWVGSRLRSRRHKRAGRHALYQLLMQRPLRRVIPNGASCFRHRPPRRRENGRPHSGVYRGRESCRLSKDDADGVASDVQGMEGFSYK